MRTKRTLLNALLSSLNLIVSSLLSLIATREILLYFGSDYNGLNSTITQFLSVLMLAESGFTVAGLVKLYKPYGEKDWITINSILSKMNQILKKIGLTMFAGGMVGACIYALFIKTSVDYATVVILFSFSIFSTAYNFFCVYKYRLLFQASQTEYVIYGINLIYYIVMYSGMILVIHITKSILLARGFSMVCSLISGMAIGLFAKKQFPSADFRADYSGVRIEGTKELFISKIVGMCYSSLTVFYLSVFTGTLYTSVYSVYNSAISLITHYVHSMSTAPQNALGQVINQEGNRLKKILAEFEYTTVLMSSILFSVTMVMLIPFVRIYTAKIVDVDYIQPLIGIFMVLTSVMQIIHIPSGLCIELSGRFRIVKRIQYIALVVLVILSSVGSYFYGFLGLLAAKLITNIVLAVIEVSYAHSKIVPHSIGLYIKITVPNLLLASLLTLCEYSIMCEINLSIWGFLITGFVITILNAVILLGFNRLLYKELLMGLTDRFKRILLKKIQKNA